MYSDFLAYLVETENSKKENDKTNGTKATKSKKKDKPLRAEVKAVLGDPTASKSTKFPIHEELIESWRIYMANGLPEEEREYLMNKYAVPKDMEAPKLNEQIAAKLSEKSIKKDTYRFEAQKINSLALTALSGKECTYEYITEYIYIYIFP